MALQTTLFYVDDDVDDLDFFSEVATGMEVPCMVFEKGNDLFWQLQNSPPVRGIIFLDLNMPIKSGYDIIAELKRSRFSNIPIVVFSTSGDYASVQQCKKLGASLYIKKVCCMSDLKEAIEFTMSIDWRKFNSDGTRFLYKSKLPA